MPVESADFVNQLDPLLPDGNDDLEEGDDHIRKVKETLVASFPGVAGPITVSHTDLNSVTGKANRAGDTYSGTHNFTGATVTYGSVSVTVAIDVPTPTALSHAVTKAYADGLAFASSLPGVNADTKGKVIVNDGVTAAWGEPSLSAVSLYYSTGVF
jgi:hypothetical protein